MSTNENKSYNRLLISAIINSALVGDRVESEKLLKEYKEYYETTHDLLFKKNNKKVIDKLNETK